MTDTYDAERDGRESYEVAISALRERHEAGELIQYERACRAVAAAKTTDEAKSIRDKSEAMRAYARQAKNKQLEVDAAEIRMRAERRVGELIIAQKETVGLPTGGQVGGRSKKDGTREEPSNRPPTLAEAGIDKKLSSRAQKLAAVPEDKFEDMVGEWRGRVERENERVTVNLLREGEKAQRDQGLAKAPTEWPAGKYPIIYADPPWRYEHPPIGASNRYSAKDARELPEAVAGRIWQYAKQRHPRHTEKNVARELGDGLSPRTVQNWRYRLPNTKRLLGMMMKWGPSFTEYIFEPIEKTAFRTQGYDAEVLEIAKRLKGLFEPEE